MKKILVFLLVVSTLSCVHEQQVIKSNKKNIKVLVNGHQTDWGISPESNPDRLKVYCFKEKNEVTFQTDSDTITFYVGNKDTIRFKVILRSKDTANTEIIGIKELPNQLTRDEKVYWLSQVWSEIKYNFVNIDKLQFNLDSLYKSLIPKALASRNDFDYYKILEQFMACLHDGHSEVYYRISPYADYIPMTLDDFNRKIYITSVRMIPEFDSTWVGSEVIKIDDIPTLEYLKTRIFPYISASTEQHLWMQANSKLMYDLIEQPFNATIKKLDGKIEKIKIQRNGESTRTPNDQYWGPKTSYSRNIVDLKWLENNIALVSFNRFTPEEESIKQFDKVARELYKAKGVIIDLRRNGGGSTLVAWHLQKYFTKENHFLNYAWETRTSDGVRKANGNWQDEYKNYFLNKAYRFEKPQTVTVSDTLKRIKNPTIILIGRFTFSAAEDFLVNIFEVPNRPKFIGEETAGSTGSPLVLPGFPGGGYARICTRRICYPLTETRFVNSGVKPDIEVKTSIEDYLHEKDVVLERAVKELNN
jgi:hypothetical protein